MDVKDSWYVDRKWVCKCEIEMHSEEEAIRRSRRGKADDFLRVFIFFLFFWGFIEFLIV